MSILIIVPIISQLKIEQAVLSERRIIAYDLHDELQHYIWNQYDTMTFFDKNKNGKIVHYSFIKENQFIKGCAKWENDRFTNEKICFNGLPKQ